MRQRSYDVFPRFAVNLDQTFRKYLKVYVFGDLHDHENLFRSFLVEKGIAFVPDIETADYQLLDNYFVKSDTLLVFLGDVLYKTPDHFKSIMRFILNNTENCLLILGNNEIKFVYEHIQLFINFIKQFMPSGFVQLLQSYVDKKESFKLVNAIYSLLGRFHKNYMCSKLKDEWLWYYSCLFKDYLLDKKNNEDLMITMFIMTKAIVMGVAHRYKLLIMHAGLNPSLSLHRQRISDICNIRTVKNTKQPWYVYYTHFNFTIAFGHWSALTKPSYQPFFHQNAICLDTECWRAQTLSYILLHPYLSYRQNVNKFKIETQISGLYTFHEVSV